MSLKMFLRADKKYKKTHNYLACRIKTKLTKLIIISPSYLETKMILAKVNKLSYIIMKHFKFLLQKSFVVLRDKANKYCCQSMQNHAINICLEKQVVKIVKTVNQ